MEGRDLKGKFVKEHKLGMTGKHHSKITIRKMSKVKKGKKFSE